MTLLALLPSPLLGSAVWEPVAQALRDLGLRAEAADVSGPAPAGARDALEAYLRALPEGEPLVLVPHSNAGLFAPAISARRDVAAVVFVDAGVPPLAGGETAVQPEEFHRFVAGLADDRRLVPVWTDWWDDADVARLFPDAEVRARVEGQQRRLPLSYFEDVVPVPMGWADRPCAYLAFGEGYRTELETARRHGWPVRVLDGGHLEMTVHPGAVAEAVATLLREATGGT